MIKRIEIEPLSLTSSKPFDQVVAALDASVGHSDIAEFGRTSCGLSDQPAKKSVMAKRRSNNKARENLMNKLALTSADKIPDAICTTGHASKLLDELRKSYQALTLEKRKQVAAFISELSCTAMKPLASNGAHAHLAGAPW